MSEVMYDAVVVGAGPGGSAAAYGLAKEGLEVLLLDGSSFPRDKTCGDGLTPRAVLMLEAMGLDPLNVPGAWRMDGVEVVAPNGRAVSLKLPDKPGWPDHIVVAPRYVLDDAVRALALEAGAQFQRVRVKGLERNSQVTVHGQQGGRDISYRGRAVVLATGANSGLLVKEGLLEPAPPPALAARAYLENVQDLPQRMQFRFDHLPLPGYGWIFPTSEATVNVGVALYPLPNLWKRRAKPTLPRAALEPFLRAPAVQASLQGARFSSPIQGFPIRMDFPRRSAASDRLLLVGEAAGLVNPLTGDGIDFALESGRLAAPHLSAALARDDLSKGALMNYNATLRERFGSLFSFSCTLQKALLSPGLLDTLVLLAERRPELAKGLANVVLGPDTSQIGKRALRRALRGLTASPR